MASYLNSVMAYARRHAARREHLRRDVRPLSRWGMHGWHVGGCTDKGVLINRLRKRGTLMTEEHNHDVELAELTADVVSAYVANNPVPVGALADLIVSVHASLSDVGHPSATAPEELVPAVNPKKSVFPDYLVSLEDGKKFKSLKRHLSSAYNLSPAEYRAKWGLPHDYPMVAPNYAAQRSALAKQIGLGQIQWKAGVRKRIGRSKADKT